MSQQLNYKFLEHVCMLCCQIVILTISHIKIFVIMLDPYHDIIHLAMKLLTANQDVPQEREHHVKWHLIEARYRHYIQQYCLKRAVNIRLPKTLPDP